MRVHQVLPMLWGANVSTMNLKSARLGDQSKLSMNKNGLINVLCIALMKTNQFR